MLNNYTIYGERCSGTHYLEELIHLNFDVQYNNTQFGWKHFFGFNDFSFSDDNLFISIVRNPFTWINSFYRNHYNVPHHLTNIHSFLNEEFYSTYHLDDFNQNVYLKHLNKPFQHFVDNHHNHDKEILVDRNIYSFQRYTNVFQLRHTKLRFMIEDLPSKVKHSILIRYEDLLHDFDNTMNKIKDKGLLVKPNITFPINTSHYKQNTSLLFDINQHQVNHLSKDLLIDRFNPYYETLLNYSF